MSKCLITTLPESVSDDTLLKIGNLKMSLNKRGSEIPSFRIYSIKSQPLTLTIVGDAYFTDSTGTANYGKERNNVDSARFYVSSGDCDVIINDKYWVTKLYSTESNVGVSLEEFRYSPILLTVDCRGDKDLTGDTSALKGKNLMEVVGLSNTSVTGHLSDFAGMENLTNLVLDEQPIKGSLSDLSTCTALKLLTLGNCDVTGNVSVLGNAYTTLHLNGTAVTGSLSSFASMADLTSLDISDTSISGDASALAGLTNLKNFAFTNCPNITGTWPLT